MMSCATCRHVYEADGRTYCTRFPPQFVGRDNEDPEKVWFSYPFAPSVPCGEWKIKKENEQ